MDTQRLVENWLKYDRDPESRKQVLAMAKEEPEKLSQIMAPRIAFGTAGLRGEMGPGFGCMNQVTVRQASQGLAVYARQNGVGNCVVVGHDHRHHSSEFSTLVEQAFTAKGFTVYSLGLVPTPFVPLAVNHYHAACGVMITASHNPAKDNGYKVYWSNGCQIIPPHDRNISSSIESNLDIWDDVDLGRVHRGHTEIKELYEQCLKPVTYLHNEASHSSTRLKVVYTPLHGTGYDVVPEIVGKLPFPVDLFPVEEQVPKDADFSTVKFPNPEEAGALDLAYRTGEKHEVNIVLANDPDADRFACALFDKDKGKWTKLTGDEVGSLLADFILAQYANAIKHDPGVHCAVINSTVSSRRLKAIAENYGARYEEALTGFKWIGNKSLDLKEQNYTVPFAYEEALGYMCLPAISDKDGMSALYVFLQLLYQVGGTASGIRRRLNEISNRIGYFSTYNSYYTVTQPKILDKIFDRIRNCADFRSTIGPLRVTRWRDLTVGYDSATSDNVPSLPVSKSTQMITVEVTPDDIPETPDQQSLGQFSARFTARGSGTEPKLKIYIEAWASSDQMASSASSKIWAILAREWFNDTGITPAEQ